MAGIRDWARPLMLILGPVFAGQTHGHDTIDQFQIDGRLGDDSDFDFDSLVGAARQHGLHQVLDGVFNHVSRGFPVFERALPAGPCSAAARWFRPRPNPDGSVSYNTFEGHQQLLALIHGELTVAEYVTAVMNHWLDRGAADHASAPATMLAHSWKVIVAAGQDLACKLDN